MTETASPPVQDFEDLIDAAGALLAVKLADGTYVDGLERNQAEELIASVPESERRHMLDRLIQDRFVSMISVDCLLDETDEHSYDLAFELAARLIEEIVRQDRIGMALNELTVAAICEEADYIAIAKAKRRADEIERGH